MASKKHKEPELTVSKWHAGKESLKLEYASEICTLSSSRMSKKVFSVTAPGQLALAHLKALRTRSDKFNCEQPVHRHSKEYCSLSNSCLSCRSHSPTYGSIVLRKREGNVDMIILCNN